MERVGYALIEVSITRSSGLITNKEVPTPVYIHTIAYKTVVLSPHLRHKSLRHQGRRLRHETVVLVNGEAKSNEATTAKAKND